MTLKFSGLVGVYITVPKVPNMLNMLDWASLHRGKKPTRRASWRTAASGPKGAERRLWRGSRQGSAGESALLAARNGDDVRGVRFDI